MQTTMPESLRSIEDEREPELSELITALDDADLALLKRYSWFINLPTERNHGKVLEEVSELYYSFGPFIRKIINGDIDDDDERVALTATVLCDIAQKHHWTLAVYQTESVTLEIPDWKNIHEEISDDLADALNDSSAQFSQIAIDRLESLIEGEDMIINLLSDCVRQRRIDIGRQALSTATGVLRVSAGTVIGMAVWSRFTKND